MKIEPWLVPLFELGAAESTPEKFLSDAVEVIATQTSLGSVALLAIESGQWRTVAARGETVSLPVELAADAVDALRLIRHDAWAAIPIASGDEASSNLTPPVAVLLIHDCDGDDATLGAIGVALSAGWRGVLERHRARRRIRRLESLLRIAQEWHQIDDLSVLFEKMATAATQLLRADRASIFLWDQNTHTLVGRPALGIESGELRIPDDAGVAGAVLASGEIQRVAASPRDDPVNREIDVDTGYATETLLCVPLTSSKGKRLGVFEVLNKRGGDFTQDDEIGLVELAAHATVALERTQQFETLIQRQRALIDEKTDGARMIGDCPAIDAIRSTIRRVADTDLAVLILGENGTGKEIAAQQLHYLSRRRAEPFLAVNCAALAETLLESELFGHERGAFTDASDSRQGKFELAHGGTLFLDEIGDMSLGGQAKLLRVLEEKTIVRVGGSTSIETDVRIIAATNQDLSQFVREKKFRQDLFYRLNVVAIELPPLRDRGEDVVLLAEHFLESFCKNMGRKTPSLTAAARRRLVGHAWPGNIRELRNMMERIAYLSPGDKVDVDSLAPSLAMVDPTVDPLDGDQSLAVATEQFQTEFIRRTIGRTQGNMTAAASRLGLHRSNLYRKMRQLDMELEE